eukprot:1260833-Rhodomonas_salina.1
MKRVAAPASRRSLLLFPPSPATSMCHVSIWYRAHGVRNVIAEFAPPSVQREAPFASLRAMLLRPGSTMSDVSTGQQNIANNLVAPCPTSVPDIA